MSTTTTGSDLGSMPVAPPIRATEVLAAQDAMDQHTATRQVDHTELSLDAVQARLPRLAPATPADLTTARQLNDQQLAARVADATGRLLQLPSSRQRYQPETLHQHRQARADAQVAATRAQQVRLELERRGWLRRRLQPQETARLQRQLEQATQQRTQALERLRDTQVRLAAIADRQQERASGVATERLWLREGAAALLVLRERAMARDLSDRDPTRTRDQHRQAGDPPDRQPPDRADRDRDRAERHGADRADRGRQGAERQPAAARRGPERT